MNITTTLKENSISLPEAPAKGGLYTPCMEFGQDGKLCYISGCGPNIGEDMISGKLGKEFTLEEGQELSLIHIYGWKKTLPTDDISV